MIQLYESLRQENVNDLSGGQYSVNKNVRCKTLMLRSELTIVMCILL